MHHDGSYELLPIDSTPCVARGAPRARRDPSLSYVFSIVHEYEREAVGARAARVHEWNQIGRADVSLERRTLEPRGDGIAPQNLQTGDIDRQAT